jgi:pimeloyl-ACP methyl ester carboxylesterase
MTFYEERQIHIPGFTIALKIWNPKAKRAVLCLHGKMDNAASFDLLAPLLPNLRLIAVDCPGTGLSSQYPLGVIPHWKNDAFLMLHLIEALELEGFDIIAHSLGSLLATLIAIAKPKQVRRLVFLDILGPTVNFIENGSTYLHRDVETYLTYNQQSRALYPDQLSAIHERMNTGNISHQAAEALVHRGTLKTEQGWQWTFDQRLRCISATIPYEDELIDLFKAIKSPVCLIRAKQGVPYPEHTFQNRAQSIKQLSIHEVDGGHHVHMDEPQSVAKIICQVLQ